MAANVEKLSVEADLVARAERARAAAAKMAIADRSAKDAALEALADLIVERQDELLRANAEDVAQAQDDNLAAALVDRLVLNEKRLESVAQCVREIAAFDDPVGEMLGMQRRPSGIVAGQVRIPLGVIAMIYESRPNVTVDAAALCLKSGNAVLLKGGKEAKRSNAALGALVREGLASAGLPEDAVQVIPATSRQVTQALIGLSGLIDLLIPRGGEGLIRYVVDNARVPVVQHYKGVCHLYVDAAADVDMAYALIENGKMQRPGVCNALECALIHTSVAEALIPRLSQLIEAGLEVRGDERSCALLPGAEAAGGDDWGEEFLAKILALRVVDDIDAALAHIARYGSNHTEAICTASYENAQRFQRQVDASCVMVNASTRFNDGAMLGLGAEVGISTTKLHAYGPMGLASLTSLKWVVQGSGQIR